MSLLSGLLRQKGITAAVDHIATQHSDERSDIPGLDDWIHAEMKKCPLDATLGLVEAAARVDIDIDEFLPKIRVPTLILTGAEYTSLITLKEAEHFRDLIPKSKLVAFPGVKAAVVGAAPERCAAEVLGFIREQDRL
jgi:pimeloyl-ACP methyl ester carboxylesterase